MTAKERPGIYIQTKRNLDPTKKGQYLVDFAIFEDGYGPRIACESEWNVSIPDIEWDFDKLRGVKADLKVMIYQWPLDDTVCLARTLLSIA